MKRFPPGRRRFPRNEYRGSFRRQATPAERAILDNAERIRGLGKKFHNLAYELRSAVTTCELADKAGWPYNPDRLQKVLALAWEIQQIRDKAQIL